MAQLVPRRICNMALVSLIVLVIQNSLLVVMTRFSRTNVPPQDNYYTSTLILNQEILKMIMCLFIFAYDDMPRLSTRSQQLSRVEDDGADAQFGGDDSIHEDNAACEAGKGEQHTLLPDSRLPIGKTVSVRISTHAGDRDGPDGSCGSSKRVTVSVGSPTQIGLILWWCKRYCHDLRAAILRRDTFKLLLPAVLFTVQNFLIFVGLSNLDAVSFQVWSQTKLLSAAMFSVWLLNRHLTGPQWLSLCVLTVGVLAAQLSSSSSKSDSSPSVDKGGIVIAISTTPSPRRRRRHSQTMTTTSGAPSSSTWIPVDENIDTANPLLGIFACVLSGLSSSYAGVYFEKVVKTTSPTLAIRNIQLSIFGIPLAFFSMLVLDIFPSWQQQWQCGQSIHLNIYARPASAVPYQSPTNEGEFQCPVRPFYFWQNYDNALTWGLVAIHALGGLLVALVVRYSDNIMKGFATGVAVIVSGFMSTVMWDYVPSWGFVLGAFLVTGSTVMFHKTEARR